MQDRAVRRSINNKIIKKRLKLLKLNNDINYKKIKEQPNRLVKKHPYDCGNPKCFLCHSDKILKNKKVRDKRIDAVVKSEIEELTC